MESIDWSIAPKDAQFYACKGFRKHEDGKEFCWDDVAWQEDIFDSMEWYRRRKDFVMRPKSPKWDGTGVPPEGTVCEYRLGEESTWFKCKIVYVLSKSEHCFVAWCDHLNSDQFLSFASDRYKLQLRKIKTPEQIAAEERNLAIDEMLSSVDRYSTFKDVMAVLYDAGYRKT